MVTKEYLTSATIITYQRETVEIPFGGHGMTKRDISSLEANRSWVATQNLSPFVGEWIAVHEESILARGRDLADVMNAVEQKSVERDAPLYMRVPEGIITT